MTTGLVRQVPHLSHAHSSTSAESRAPLTSGKSCAQLSESHPQHWRPAVHGMSRQTAVWHNNLFCHVGICCLQFLLDMHAFAVNFCLI